MSTTGQAVINLLHQLPSDVTNAKTIQALNAAIADAWPTLGVMNIEDDAITLVASTPEYELSTLTMDQRFGVSQIFLTEDTALPDIVWRTCRQRYDPTTGYWTLILPSALYDGYAGKTLSLTYYTPQPAITALTTSIDLPESYLLEYVIFWYLKDARYSNEKSAPSMSDINWQEARMIETRKRYKRPIPQVSVATKDRMR